MIVTLLVTRSLEAGLRNGGEDEEMRPVAVGGTSPPGVARNRDDLHTRRGVEV